MAEFCPRCTAPLEASPDSDRLCECCGWWGDQREALLTPPANAGNPVLAAAQALELYRDVCRQELLGEQLYEAGSGTEAQLHKLRMARRDAAHSIIEMFVALRGRAAKQH